MKAIEVTSGTDNRQREELRKNILERKTELWENAVTGFEEG